MVTAILEMNQRKSGVGKKRREGIRIKKSNETRRQNQTLDCLYLLACKAPDLESLYVLRASRETKVLTRINYAKFILLLDRLMESL